MNMSRKDYKAIAEAIVDSTRIDDAKSLIKADFIYYLCSILKKDNPNFNKDSFEEACNK